MAGVHPQDCRTDSDQTPRVYKSEHWRSNSPGASLEILAQCYFFGFAATKNRDKALCLFKEAGIVGNSLARAKYLEYSFRHKLQLGLDSETLVQWIIDCICGPALLRDVHDLTGDSPFPTRLRDYLSSATEGFSGKETTSGIMSQWFANAVKGKLKGPRLTEKKTLAEFRAAVKLEGNNPNWLLIAAQEGSGEIIRLLNRDGLLELDMDFGGPRGTALRTALLHHNTSALFALIDLGADTRTLFDEGFLRSLIIHGKQMVTAFRSPSAWSSPRNGENPLGESI